MDSFKKFSLYDDEKRSTTGTSTGMLVGPNEEQESLLEIDLSEPSTLFQMSKQVRDALKNKPEDYQLTVYLVCGNVCSKDAGLFADYLKNVTHPILVAFRGIIHFDFIHLFFYFPVYVNKSSQIAYSKIKLHDTLKNLLYNPDAYRKFVQRFVDEYWALNEGNLLQISELSNLGIKTETF